MTPVQQSNSSPAGSRKGIVFGVPLGDLGLFSSLLMACTVGFLTFFLVTFLAIIGILVYNGAGHHLDYADSYKFISFPAGCFMLIVSLIFFGTLWVRRKLSRG
jgi:hypothetical protein